jgi:hypothetical protein
LNIFELSATIMTNSSPDHNTSASKTIGLVHTLVRKTFPTTAVYTITFITKTKWRSGFIAKKDVLPGVKPSTTARTSPGYSPGPKFRRLLDHVFYGQCPQPLSYGSGGE